MAVAVSVVILEMQHCMSEQLSFMPRHFSFFFFQIYANDVHLLIIPSNSFTPIKSPNQRFWIVRVGLSLRLDSFSHPAGKIHSLNLRLAMLPLVCLPSLSPDFLQNPNASAYCKRPFRLWTYGLNHSSPGTLSLLHKFIGALLSVLSLPGELLLIYQNPA